MIQTIIDTYFALPLLLILFIPLFLLFILLGGLIIVRATVRSILQKSRNVQVVPAAENPGRTQKSSRMRAEVKPEEPETKAPPVPAQRNQAWPLILFFICIVLLLWHFGIIGK